MGFSFVLLSTLPSLLLNASPPLFLSTPQLETLVTQRLAAAVFRVATRRGPFFGLVEGGGAGTATRGRMPDGASGGGSLRWSRSLSRFPPPAVVIP